MNNNGYAMLKMSLYFEKGISKEDISKIYALLNYDFCRVETLFTLFFGNELIERREFCDDGEVTIIALLKGETMVQDIMSISALLKERPDKLSLLSEIDFAFSENKLDRLAQEYFDEYSLQDVIDKNNGTYQRRIIN